ncbi:MULTISPECIES: monovalent cation/H+ antiporter complex subunit F [Rhodobacterales]|uniref:monovalent cation/H+ antiporter complex subunit F n=1 Tax=Roseobacter sp. N2S TaxID=2663844 RepID=UPI00285F8FF8|nr:MULTISPECIES: monovalent cation/H+ antiporter complex subunit F [Rhodobacterales]MDR6264461.1 multicomponent Na+:H+ antiporter subunit F [Roseobacter sp. N2S]
MMFLVAAIALFVSMVLVLVRLYAGPIVYDRVLAVNFFGTATVLFIAVLGFLTERPDFLDIALLYALINFVGTIAILKFFRYRGLGDIGQVPEQER